MEILGDPAAATVTGLPTNGTIVDAFVQGKGFDAESARQTSPCEDHLVITNSHVAVIDGMSSPLREPGTTGSGRAYALAVASAIEGLSPESDARSAFNDISHSAAAVEVNHEGPAGAVVAILSLTRREIWRVGDINVRIGNEHFLGTKLVDEAAALFRAAIDNAYLAGGLDVDEIRSVDPGLKAAGSLFRVQDRLANRLCDFGYGVVNGRPIPSEFIEVFPIPENVEEIALSSDGFLNAGPSLETVQFELTSELAGDEACVGSQLRGMGKGIPLGGAVPDDRCFVRVSYNRTSETKRVNFDAE